MVFVPCAAEVGGCTLLHLHLLAYMHCTCRTEVFAGRSGQVSQQGPSPDTSMDG